MIAELLSAILQIAFLTLIPFVVYVIQHKKTTGFFEYIGLKKSTLKANLFAVLLCLFLAGPLIILSALNPEFYEIMMDPSSMTGQFRKLGFGVEAVIILFITAVFKTGLAEEILFRGFIAKRLIALTSYRTGNILQSLLFGIIHSLLFLSVTDNFFFLFVIFIFPAVAAYFKVFLNEKVADGSIIPGWITHALANVLSYSIIGFLI